MAIEHNDIRVYGRSVRNEDIHWECSRPEEQTMAGYFYTDREFAAKTACSRCGRLLIDKPG